MEWMLGLRLVPRAGTLGPAPLITDVGLRDRYAGWKIDILYLVIGGRTDAGSHRRICGAHTQ